MKKNTFKSLLLAIICLLLNFNLQAQDVPPVTVNVATAGTLPNLIASSKKYQITNLTVTGNLNGTDMLYIREMAGSDVNGDITSGKLSVLDLSGVNIVAGGSKYYYDEYYKIDYTTSLNKIGDFAFSDCTGLTSITIPNSVTSIGNYAFNNCTGLTSVNIPNSVTSIGNYAFINCTGLTSVNIPNSVTSIGDNAFNSCTKLTSIIIPNSVTSIGDSAFNYCTGLTSITIPNSVTSIGSNAFYYCTGLTSVNIGSGVTSIGYSAFSDCTGLTSITIPNSVTSIELLTFKNCTGLTSVNIGSGVTSIGNYAFNNCTGLTSVNIGSGVTSIGNYAFNNCTGLTSVNIGSGVTSIGNYAFYGCKISTLNYNPINCTLAATAFAFQSSLKILNIGDNVKTLPNNIFKNCIGLTSITIPNSVTSIGQDAFWGCTNLKEFIVTENNSTYSSVDGVLFNKNFTELIACPNAKSNIYTIPNSVTSIGGYAFYGCTGLNSVTIPNSVTSIENYAFQNCTGLKEIHCKALTPPVATSNSFAGITATCKLYVPKGSYGLYWATTGWGDFTNIIEEESTSTAISQFETGDLKVYVDQDAIIVTGAELGDNISVYTESGALLQTTKVKDNTIRIAVPSNKIYLIRTTDKTFKVAL